MSDTRRRFLKRSALGLAAVAAAPRASAAADGAQQAVPPAGMPPAFGTGPGTGPEGTRTELWVLENFLPPLKGAR